VADARAALIRARYAPPVSTTRDDDLAAALYAAVHSGTPGDVELVLRACEGGQRVLELGCGDGRIARALALAGHDVIGIDIDEARLALGRARAAELPETAGARLELRHGDMRAIAIDGTVERVVIAHSTLYCLRSDDEVRAMLRGARRALAPGGTIVIDAYAADPFHGALDPGADDPFEEVARVQVAGRAWRVLERSDWDHDGQSIVVRYRHEPEDGGDPVEITIEHRYVLADHLLELLRHEGFEPLVLAGGYDGRPYDDDAEQMIVIAERG